MDEGEMTEPEFSGEDVERALRDARRFRDEGKFAHALERHVWYHENALKYLPEHFGVRLSFALSDWAELGDVYPAAIDALRIARDNSMVAYRKKPSDPAKFAEAMSMNFALDDLQSAKAMFYQGRKLGITQSLRLNLARIMAAGEIEWARDVVDDPCDALDELNRYRKLSAEATDRPELGAIADKIFAGQVVNILNAIAATDGMPAAVEVQKKALQMLESRLIRTALRN
jgi:hypothetical protein